MVQVMVKIRGLKINEYWLVSFDYFRGVTISYRDGMKIKIKSRKENLGFSEVLIWYR